MGVVELGRLEQTRVESAELSIREEAAVQAQRIVAMEVLEETEVLASLSLSVVSRCPRLSPQVLPVSPCISLYLLVFPYISLYLPRSSCVSLYLPVSP